MTAEELKRLIAGGETLTVEFKSDRKGLPDRDLVESVVALANTEGGVLLLGVEDGTGEITGLHPSHVGKGTPAAMIANRTVPSVQVRVEEVLSGLLATGDVVEMEGVDGLFYELSPATIRAFTSGKEPSRMNGESYENIRQW